MSQPEEQQPALPPRGLVWTEVVGHGPRAIRCYWFRTGDWPYSAAPQFSGGCAYMTPEAGVEVCRYWGGLDGTHWSGDEVPLDWRNGPAFEVAMAVVRESGLQPILGSRQQLETLGLA